MPLLSMAQENYQKALNYLTAWRNFTGKALAAGDHLLFAQNHYQLKQYVKAVESIEQASYITKGSDMNTLAQLYLYHGVPYKSAKVMEQAMAEGKLPRAEKYLQLVAQSYLIAKNDDKAITPLSEAAKVAEHGNFDAQLAEIYINSQQRHKAIVSANMALGKGRLNNPGNIYIVLGMANYNLNRFEKSLYALTRAKSFSPTQSMASQWISYVSKEQKTGAKRARL